MPKMSAGDILTSEVVNAMEKAGTPPQIIYAYRKTGLIVTESNRHLLGKADLAEWNAAIDEYYAKEEKSPRR